MGPPPRRRRRRRRWVQALTGLTVAFLAAVAGLWWGVHRVPGWYEPVVVPEARLDDVRNDAVRAYNRVGDGLVHRKPFEITLGERQVSEWIAARERLWPESRGWVPADIEDLVVRFREGHIIFAARVNLGGQSLIAGAFLSIALGNDDLLVLRLERLRVGALPVPVGTLAGPLARLLRLEGCDLDLLPSPVADTACYFRESDPTTVLSEGVRRANRFIWENGRRPFRITAVRIADGNLTLTLGPL